MTRDTVERTMASSSKRPLRRLLRTVALAWLVASSVVLPPPDAAAQGARTQFIAEKLKSDDFRVRTNAALALGATNDEAAVQPLCGALSDGSPVVRQASAAALKRLAKPSAVGCLKSRAALESNADVKLQIERALASLDTGGGGGGAAGGGGGGGGALDFEHPKENASAKYYVSLSPVANRSSRAQNDVDTIVLGAMRDKLDAAGSMQLAPRSEKADAARAAISKRKLKGGFYLAVALEKPDYAGGRLQVKLRVAVFSYPSKSLLGNLDKTLTQDGVQPGDKGAEDNLLQAAAGLAAEQFAQNAAAFL